MDLSNVITQALPAGTRIEEFVIEKVLGSGGFGITYLVRDTGLNRQVVIKENLPAQFAWRDPASGTVRPRHTTSGDRDDFEWSLTNFLREAETLASLDHPGIVRVLRKFETNGTAYFVMPFVEGVAFDSLIESRRAKEQAFSEEELKGLLDRMLAALGYLHDRGIYHRDIKPGNILITNDGIPVLIDFGSARQRLSERSMTVIESPGYTPFEQLQSHGNVGPWSDLYALGGTLAKAIAFENPPNANDRAFDDPWVPLARRVDLCAVYSVGVLSGIDRAMAMRIENRWKDAGEWLAALRENVPVKAALPAPLPPRPVPDARGQQTTPKLPPSPQATPPWTWRGWAVLALIALVVGLPLVGLPLWNDSRKPSTSTATAQAKASEERDFEIAPGVQIKMCWIPPGEFVMGSPTGESGRSDDETQHQVKITQGFWMGKTEVTQGQWRAVMGDNPSGFNGEDLPVERVSWNGIAGPGGFIEKANQSGGVGGVGGDGGTGGRFSLPTEAQWEYACRAGTTGAYSGDLDQMAWYDKNSGGKTHPVGLKKPNAWGLHDMHGNVWEWCADWYGAYPGGAMTDPQGAASGSYRVGRGGYWFNYAFYCRVAIRNGNSPTGSGNGVGFRVARSSVP